MYQDSIAPLIVVSGGLGVEGYYEGDIMADYLIAKGVSREAIVIDNKGNNSQRTANNLREIFPKINKVTVVSQYYHITRYKLAFINAGFNIVNGGIAIFMR